MAGFRVVAVDLFADTDLREMASAYRLPATRYPDGFIDLVDQITARRPIAGWFYTGGLENYPVLVGKDQPAAYRCWATAALP